MSSLLLEDQTLPEQAYYSLNVVMTSANLLLTLINNILDVRKIDNRMMDAFQLGPLNLSKALVHSVDFCKPYASITGVNLRIDTNGLSKIHVTSNDLRFQQIMINLISNAIKYSPAGTTVSVSAQVMSFQEAEDIAFSALASGSSPQPDRSNNTNRRVAVISVSDEGAGVPQDDESVTHIFEKFSQLSIHPQTAIGGKNKNHHAQPTGTGPVHSGNEPVLAGTTRLADH